MKLVILCEGPTEKAVLKDFLQPFCLHFQSVRVRNFYGNAKLIKHFKEIAELDYLAVDESTIVFCLIDIYQAPLAFPQTVDAMANPLDAQYAFIKDYFEKQIDSQYGQRFFAFPVVMEVETWLLADSEGLNAYFKPNKQQRIKAYPKPEAIEHPKQATKDLWKRFRVTDYNEHSDGAKIFKQISAERVYQDTCPHFEMLVNKLYELQGLPSPKISPSVAPHSHASGLFLELARLEQALQSALDQVIDINDEKDPALLKALELEQELKLIQTKIANQLGN